MPELTVKTAETDLLDSAITALTGLRVRTVDGAQKLFKASVNHVNGPAPQTLDTAAGMIQRLTQQLDDLKRTSAAQIASMNKAQAEAVATISNHASAIVQGQPVPPTSPLISLERKLNEMRKQVADADQSVDETRAYCEARISLATSTDHATATLAAESLAVYAFGDEQAKTAFLRRRGWFFVAQGIGETWKSNELKVTTTKQDALERQYKADASAFKQLGTSKKETANA